MPLTAALAVVLAAGLDVAVAEPPARVHPVALLGRLVSHADRTWSHPRLVGVVLALAAPLGFAGVAGGVVAAAETLSPWVGALFASLVLFAATSLRMLLDAVRDVTQAAETDLDAARTELRALAGRDASALDAAHVRSAAVESVAENLADGLVAPLFAFAVCAPFSLPLAAAAAAWVKGVNTLDSMFGYRSKPIGWAPARLDDVVMWLPARLAGVLLAVSVAEFSLPFSSRVRTLARRPPSPNSGWPMATMAAVLPARLVKPGVYDLDPASDTANTRLPTTADAMQAVRVTNRAGLLAFALAGVIAWF
ncbi:cobalamin biosynthesis protein CobD [Halogeometricum borinquense]|uniref:Probable cobalamin biosynthesis protein CobD n=1 Tax=Halogeometricum borinquense TaxID=60847 RepID=A0A482T5L4_9EURY|nr:adenosylcobinamide-phosphate synthase CbiB [Halogeometricum borinquense]RYJ12930.1 cobalamin biosynthesis protein CobD [Halogeometricum borinquense]